MGAKEEETGNVVSGAPIMGEPWWLISEADGTAFCCHMAASWFKARDIGLTLTGQERVVAELIFK
jgi:hypothetical protein